jgi:hypothetical protein
VSDPSILVVSTRETFLSLVTHRWLDEVASRTAAPDEVGRLVTSHALFGMVIDAAALPARLTRPLVDLYLRSGSPGQIAVMSEMDDITTLTAFAFRDPRVDIFFAPWAPDAVRSFLGVGVRVRTTSR